MKQNCFIPYKSNIKGIKLPNQFTYPFNYQPHTLAVIAAKELQEHLLTQTEWVHNFGIEQYINETNVGKMFGVLVVQDSNKNIGYLAAFSGKLANTNKLPFFVPPVYDLQKEDGFFKIGEQELNEINKSIVQLENNPSRLHLIQQLAELNKEAEAELQAMKLQMKTAKIDRNKKREEARKTLTDSEYRDLTEILKNESLKYQYDYKVLAKKYKDLIAKKQEDLYLINYQITILKEKRKAQSAGLQKQLFDQYKFLNIKGEFLTASEIFKNTPLETPPAGTGECAAPKLLQYAFLNRLTPICMCEFWWGQSPKSEIRKHGNYYPSCKSKCEPILKHMLNGLNIETNPTLLLPIPSNALNIIFEDDILLIINKPHNFLTVPGNIECESIYSLLKKKYPEAEGPLIVHRLDMSTSGLLVIAKTKETHANLQKQFLNREVKKRYTAILDGIINEEEGFIKLPLIGDYNHRPQQMVCYQNGKPAITKWKKIGIEGQTTRVHFYPYTGRTHQLRVHAAHIDGLNTPILGDDIYGSPSKRLHLHAEYLSFRHPNTGKKMHFNIAPDF